jgi:hypothetical protein
LLDYLKKNAQKAYKEISSIIEKPIFLFSNDPDLIKRESNYNYCYLHGFNRLIKHNRITNDRLLEVFGFLEDKIEEYLKQHYQSKKFIYYLNGDAQIPAFTLSVVSFHDYRQIMNSTDLIELIEWYRSNACFDGLRIIEEQFL